jgi:hypothetical protein
MGATAQSLDEILSKHFKAVGQDNLMAAKSFSVKAKLSQMGMEMPMEMKIKKTGQFLITVTMQGEKMIQAFDGEKGWMIAPWISAEPVELGGEQLKQAQDQTNLEGELYDYKKKGSTADFAGKVNLDGKEAYRIKLTASDGNAKDYFIDAQTFYITKVKAQVSAQGQTVDVEQIMSDYKTIDGITMPMKIETKSPMGSGFIIMEELSFNQNFDDAIFRQPAK